MTATTQRLSLPRCRACGKHHSYPRVLCPFCASTDLEWTTLNGTGAIYSIFDPGTADKPFDALGFSPDEADAFALTFAQDVAALRLPGDRSEPARRFCVMDFDPLDRNWREKARRAGHYLVD